MKDEKKTLLEQVDYLQAQIEAQEFVNQVAAKVVPQISD